MKKEIIYLIKFDNGIKFGRTKDPTSRLQTYFKPWCRPVIELYTIETCNSMYIEKYLKDVYSDNIKEKSYEFITNVEFEQIKVKLFEIISLLKKRHNK
jgi:hypothetical protein